jgi:hypothetical protein
MSTYENRIEALEQRVADIELERLYEKRKTIETTPSEQAYDIKQVNHRLTMLLGVTSGQEHAIRTMQGDMDLRFDAVDTRFDKIDARLNAVDVRFDKIEADMVAMEGRILNAFQQLVTIIDTRLPQQEK